MAFSAKRARTWVGDEEAKRAVPSPNHRRWAAPVLGLAVWANAVLTVGCASGGAGGEAALQAAAFAPELGVNLAEMTRTEAGVYLLDLRPGQGQEAERGLRVTVHYEGWFPDGRRFDSSREAGEPVSFTLGRREVIRGWDEGLVGMREGGLRRLVVPSNLGYGARGVGNAIPPGAILVFDIELVRVGEAAEVGKAPTLN